MVRLGDPRDAIDPFVVDCAPPGHARWTDSRTWAFDFDEPVGGGVRCSFELKSDVRTLNGDPVDGASASFSTGGPTVAWYQPSYGEIEEDQVVVLGLDAAATDASIAEHAYFAADDVGERIGVRLIEGADRDAVLATLYPELLKNPTVLVQPRQSLPPGRKVRLVLDAGIATPGGIATTSPQTLEFETRPEFTATFRCRRSSANADCNPLLPMSVSFSAPIDSELAKQVTLRRADGTTLEPAPEQYDSATRTEVRFLGAFRESTDFEVILPEGLVDDAGRPLANEDRFPLSVRTATYPPLAKFAARFGILEANADPALPVTIRNVEPQLAVLAKRATAERDTSLSAQLWRGIDWLRGRVRHIPAAEIDSVIPWLRRLATTPRETSVFADADLPEATASESFTLPKPLPTEETEVLGIPLTMPGLHIVEIESPRLGAALLGKNEPMYVPAAVLVTNLGVHFKWGATSSLVWVTHLDDASPAAGVDVQILDCEGTHLAAATTDEQGRVTIADLPRPESVVTCSFESWPDWFWSGDYRALQGITRGLMVVARTQDDFSFVHSSWDDGIEPWRFRVDTRSYGDPTPLRLHTVLDRTLFRAGETVHMKHVIRRQTESGLATPVRNEQPTDGRIVHSGSQQRYPIEITNAADGVAESTWKIPDGAKLGTYRIELGDDENRVTSAEFRVEEFRVPLMTGSIDFGADERVAPESVDVDLSLRYLAGGTAGGAPIVVRSQVRPRSLNAKFPWDDLRFAEGPVETGIVTQPSQSDSERSDTTVQRTELTLDAAGTKRFRIDSLPKIDRPVELLVELEYRDPVGETQTLARTLPLVPADRLIAIRPESWIAKPDRIAATVVVVDPAGNPVDDADVEVRIFDKQVFSHRKRLVGGFYSYQHVTEVTGPVATLCHGRTTVNGAFLCTGKTELSGNLLLEATVRDDAGRISATHTDVWVAGDEPWWFEAEDHDRIDLLPERSEVDPGDVARIQVRSPFREATALVTIEREGVLDSFVTYIDGHEPVIEVPVRGAYAPNVFVSVLAVRGRVADIAPTARLDLGKPAYKLGLTELRVGWTTHRLDVDVRTDKEVYETRSTALVDIALRTEDGAPLPAGAEVAVAAVDEGLLELSPNPTWSLLDAMMELRGDWVSTSTAQGQVVGKRHFGRKALPIGGGGGRRTVRELFDTLLFWNARVPVGADGKARVEVPLNDSLTSFRIVAIAQAGSERFGTGSTSIRTHKPLMLLSGLPPIVRTGDRFPAEFTLRNATEAPQSIEIDAAADGVGDLPSRHLELAPGESAPISWDIDVPQQRERIDLRVRARAGEIRDEVRASVRVVPVHRVETLQATIGRVDREFRVPVRKPADAEANRGGIEVSLAKSLTGGLAGVYDYMREYPYPCLEQRVSKAIVLHRPEDWQAIVDALPTYIDKDGLLKFFPTMTRGSVALSSYVLSVAASAGLEIPEETRNRIVGGLIAFLNGSLEGRDAEIASPLNRLTAIEALARHGAAQPEMLDTITIEPALWPTNGVIDLWSIALRLEGLKAADDLRSDAARILRSRLRQQGTFADVGDGGSFTGNFLRCDDSGLLRLVDLLVESDSWPDELPLLVRGALQHQRRGHWRCTTSNALGTLAVEHFAAAHESEAVAGTVDVALGDGERRVEWASVEGDRAEIDLPWPTEAKAAEVKIEQAGTGRPWAIVRARAALPLREPIEAGYRLHRKLEPVEQRKPGEFHRGDIWRVVLDIDASVDAAWVVVDDPLPPGASHLGTGLGRERSLDAADDAEAPNAVPTFVERRHESFRAYFERLDEGSHRLTYTIRLNQSGRFALPASRVEAMYAPETFAAVPIDPVDIAP